MRRWRPAAFAAVLIAALVPALPAQTLSVSLAAGRLFPPGGDYREIYGAGASFSGDVWLKLKGPIGFAAGFGALSDRGLAIRTGEGAEQPLRFRRISIPLVAFYEFGAGSLALRLGAGMSFQSYRETWQNVDLSYRGRGVSPRLVLAASWRFAGRFSIFASAAYDAIRAGGDSPLLTSVSLGGLQLFGGLAFKII